MAEAKSEEGRYFNTVVMDEVLNAHNIDPVAFELLADQHMQNIFLSGGEALILRRVTAENEEDNVPSWTRHMATEPGEGVVR
jgi:hypothetical protein